MNLGRYGFGAALLVCALPLLVGASQCGGDDSCGPFAIDGERADFTVGGLERERWAISLPDSCADDYDEVERVVVTGKGSVPFANNTEIVDWLYANIIEADRFYYALWTDGYECNGRWPGVAIGVGSWAEADALAKALASQFAADDRSGEVAIILESYVVCAY